MAATTKVFVDNSPPQAASADLNGYKNENNNLIAGSGEALNISDPQQTHKAVSLYSLVGQFYTGGGIADVYTMAAVSPRVAPDALKDGMVFRAVFPADNTGAATVDPFTLGVNDIKLPGGVTDPSAGDILGGEETPLIYRTSPSAHFEINPTVRLVVISASGSYVKPAGLKKVFVELVGGGAGGGGASGSGSGSSSGGGGGAGEYRSGDFAASALSASETVTIGAFGGGGSSSGGNGGAGGNTSFGALLVGNGGASGVGDATRSTTVARGEAGGAGGSGGSGGTRTVVGQKGGMGGNFNTTASSGQGGDSQLGLGGGMQVNGGAGLAGTGAGGGGSGGAENGATGRSGGTGSTGLIVIREFY